MLRVGIPDYRLPQDVLDKEIDYTLGLGIDIETGKRLGTDFSLDDLVSDGYKAVFLGIGAHKSMNMNIPGEEELEGVLDAVGFLRDVSMGERNLPGSRIGIIGGGNVAIDAARTALRLGAEEVSIIYKEAVMRCRPIMKR